MDHLDQCAYDTTGGARATGLAGAFADSDVLADRAAIAAEPLLPAPGTPARDRLHVGHAMMCAGLIAGCRRHAGSAP